MQNPLPQPDLLQVNKKSERNTTNNIWPYYNQQDKHTTLESSPKPKAEITNRVNIHNLIG